MKKVYEALKPLEGGEDLIKIVKESVQSGADFEKENRTLKSEAEQYKELDIAELKTIKEFVEKSGGVETLQGAIAKAEGYDTNEEKLNQQKSDYEALKLQHEKDAEGFATRIAESNLRAELLPQFADSFKGSNVLLDHAMKSGMVGTGETGLFFKSGDTVIPFSAGGFDKLKEHDDFSFALKTPSGGDEGGGSGGGSDNTQNKTQTMLEQVTSTFQE